MATNPTFPRAEVIAIEKMVPAKDHTSATTPIDPVVQRLIDKSIILKNAFSQQ